MILWGTQEPQPKIVGEYAPWEINNAEVAPTIIHVTIHPTAVLKKTLQFIPEHVRVFSNKPTPTVAPTWQCVVESGIFNLEPVIYTVISN